MSYSWKELDLENYSVTTIINRYGYLKREFQPDYAQREFQRDVGSMELEPSIEVHIILPNGSRLKFYPGEFNLSEFLDLDKLEEKLKEGSKKKKIFEISSRVILVERSVVALVVLAFKYYYIPKRWLSN